MYPVWQNGQLLVSLCIICYDYSETCFFLFVALAVLWELLILSAWWVDTMESLVREALRWRACNAWTSATDNGESKFWVDDHCEILELTY